MHSLSLTDFGNGAGRFWTDCGKVACKMAAQMNTGLFSHIGFKKR